MTNKRHLYILLGVVVGFLVLVVIVATVFGGNNITRARPEPGHSFTQTSSPAPVESDEVNQDSAVSEPPHKGVEQDSQPSLEIAELAPLPATADPLEYGRMFAQIWMAPNPTAYSYEEFIEWVQAEHVPNPLDETLTLATLGNVEQQVLLPVLWDAAAESGLVQDVDIEIVELAGWLYGTELEEAYLQESVELGWPNPATLEVWGTCLKEENGHQLGHDCRALLAITCTEDRCGLIDVGTTSIGQIPGTAEYVPQGWEK